MKVCTRCKKELPFGSFYINSGKPRSCCMECVKRDALARKAYKAKARILPEWVSPPAVRDLGRLAQQWSRT